MTEPESEEWSSCSTAALLDPASAAAVEQRKGTRGAAGLEDASHGVRTPKAKAKARLVLLLVFHGGTALT